MKNALAYSAVVLVGVLMLSGLWLAIYPLFVAGCLLMIGLAGWAGWTTYQQERLLNRQKIKMYVVFAKESLDKMKGIRGKMIAQGGHGFLHAFWDSQERFPDFARAYRRSARAYKIGLVVPTVADLQTLEAAYRNVCGVSLVTDAGLTVFNEPTTTCLGIGPIPESLMGDDLRTLKTLT